ncbi:hypothetical protein [Turicimonas muris]|uniref:hypothetical protein n=1 Tax=Turicimonas muris TaxID=1796652 RepID=UPI00248CED20|nr:hypothetical protein [Turicimonas muris]
MEPKNKIGFEGDKELPQQKTLIGLVKEEPSSFKYEGRLATLEEKAKSLKEENKRHENSISKLQEKIDSCIPNWALNLVISMAAILVAVLLTMLAMKSSTPIIIYPY